MEQELIKALINAGVGAIIAVIILYGLYRLANKFCTKFIESQNSQTAAINRLSDTLVSSNDRDQSEHREIIILLKVISEKIENIERHEDGS